MKLEISPHIFKKSFTNQMLQQSIQLEPSSSMQMGGGRTYGRMEGRTDGWMERQTDMTKPIVAFRILRTRLKIHAYCCMGGFLRIAGQSL